MKPLKVARCLVTLETVLITQLGSLSSPSGINGSNTIYIYHDEENYSVALSLHFFSRGFYDYIRTIKPNMNKAVFIIK